MLSLDETPRVTKGQLLEAARKDPASVFRLAKYLKLNTTGYSVKQTAKLIDWLIKRIQFRL